MTARLIAGLITITIGVSYLFPASAAEAAASPSSVIQPGLWESRRGAAKETLSPVQSLAPTQSLLQTPDPVSAGFLPAPLRDIPYKHGDIVKVNLAKNPRAPFVLLVQDARKAERVQRSIAGSLAHIQSRMKGQRLLVGLEGFEGAYDLNLYRAQRKNLAQREVWDELVAKSLISGAEYFGLTADNEPVLWGAETGDLYKASFDAFQYGPEAEKDAQRWIASMRSDLDQVKALIFPDDLMKLDRLNVRYESGEISLSDYLKFFSRLPDVGAGKYPEVEKYLALMQAEKGMDVKKVEEDRARLMKHFSTALNAPELKQLVEMSFAHRVGRIGAAQYYGYLRSLMTVSRAEAKRFPELNNYIQYALMSERINPAALSENVRALRDACIARLAKTPTQREAAALTAALSTVQKLVAQSLTAGEWSEYSRSQEQARQLPVSVLLLKERVERMFRGSSSVKTGSKSAAKKPGVSNLSGYNELLSAYEGFYGAAQPRKKALADNFVRQVRQQPGAEVSVMIAGGFHSAQLSEELESRGVSYAVFRPRF